MFATVPVVCPPPLAVLAASGAGSGGGGDGRPPCWRCRGGGCPEVCEACAEYHAWLRGLRDPRTQ